MEFGAVLKELTYKSVCLFFIFSYSFFAVACVAQHEEDKAIAVSEMCIFKKVLYNIPIDSIDRQIYKASFFNRHRGKYSYCLTIYASNGIGTRTYHLRLFNKPSISLFRFKSTGEK